jgi:stalled ribosome rescue protein Dom34
MTEEDDDLWFLYNLILPGDNIRTVTYRFNGLN